MKVVLLQNIKNVGQKGEVKEVSEGFARNHLIPQGLAKVGTEKTLKEVQKLSHDKKKHEEAILFKTQEAFEAVSGKTFRLDLKSNKEGSLFAKFDEKNLLDFFHKEGYKSLEKKHLTIVGGAIKNTGTYTILLKENKLTSSCVLIIT